VHCFAVRCCPLLARPLADRYPNALVDPFKPLFGVLQVAELAASEAAEQLRAQIAAPSEEALDTVEVRIKRQRSLDVMWSLAPQSALHAILKNVFAPNDMFVLTALAQVRDVSLPHDCCR
jgi:hypothetical protein